MSPVYVLLFTIAFVLLDVSNAVALPSHTRRAAMAGGTVSKLKTSTRFGCGDKKAKGQFFCGRCNCLNFCPCSSPQGACVRVVRSGKGSSCGAAVARTREEQAFPIGPEIDDDLFDPTPVDFNKASSPIARSSPSPPSPARADGLEILVEGDGSPKEILIPFESI